MKFLKDFMEFMEKQKIISIALAFIVGLATVTLVQALVADIITPIYAPYFDFLNPNAYIQVGLSRFFVGDFIRQLVNWVVILLVVYAIGKKLEK